MPLSASPASARERILGAAFGLFSQRGIRAVGVDEVVQEARVAKATLYRHFRSKDELVLAYLALYERRWTRDFLEAAVLRRGATPQERLLAIFDAFDEWFAAETYRGSALVNALVEMGPRHRAGRASIAHLQPVRTLVAGLAREAGLSDIEEFERSWHILMQGSIVAALEGDSAAAKRAKALGRMLITAHYARGQPGARGAAETESATPPAAGGRARRGEPR
jgi:AcrR family transcriptional regulator